MPETDNDTAPKTDESKAPKFDGEFDAERASRLIENLRAEVASLKDEKKSLADSLQAREDAEKTEAQKAADRAAAAEERAKAAERSLYVERAVRKHSLPEEVVEFLTGDTEEEILTKAERLAALGKPKGDESEGGEKKDETDEGKSPTPGRPSPSLTPGHGGDPSEPFDADAIVAAARSNSY